MVALARRDFTAPAAFALAETIFGEPMRGIMGANELASDFSRAFSKFHIDLSRRLEIDSLASVLGPWAANSYFFHAHASFKRVTAGELDGAISHSLF